mgnify:CR=1 FL=1
MRKALECSGDDPETLALLERRPLWQAWDGLQGDLAIFLEACLTNCWGTYGHHLVSKESLRVDGLEDGGAYFGGSADRMTLQRAIAEQIVENLDLARKKHPETRRKGGRGQPGLAGLLRVRKPLHGEEQVEEARPPRRGEAESIQDSDGDHVLRSVPYGRDAGIAAGCRTD